MAATLYSWPEAWGLASASPACLQVEAYLRLARAHFHVQPCATPSKSPTGQLPALECGASVSPGSAHEFLAAREAIHLARASTVDLDAQLTPPQRAVLLAFSSLIQHRLEAATEYTMWCEPTGYREYTKAAFASQPFPLSVLVPWSMRREARKRYGHLKADLVYTEACEALAAVADRLGSSSHPFLLGPHPCSLDAALLGHLLFYRTSPAAAPVLRDKVASTPVLNQYIDNAESKYFAGAAPRAASSTSAPGPGTASSSPSFSWSHAAKGQQRGGGGKPAAPTETEREFRRKSWWWLAGAAMTTVGYILLSNRYISVEQLQALLGADDEDEDGDDADDGDDE